MSSLALISGLVSTALISGLASTGLASTGSISIDLLLIASITDSNPLEIREGIAESTVTSVGLTASVCF